MKTNQAGIDLIKQFEGYRLEPYKDAVGLPTIGIGHLIRHDESFTSLTQEEAEELLRKDLHYAESAVNQLINVSLNENQFSALVSFTFNLGSGILKASTLRMKLNRGEYDKIPQEIKRYCFAGGKKLSGLARRREAEAALFAKS